MTSTRRVRWMGRLKTIASKWAIPEKNKKGTGRGGEVLRTNPLEFLSFLLYPRKFQNKTSPHPPHKTVLYSLEILRPKTKTPGLLEIPHDFFLITPGNSSLFLSNPWKFHLLFLQYPQKFHILNPPVWVFPRIAQYG